MRFMREHAGRLVAAGMHIDRAADDAVDLWEKSVRRVQLMRRYHDELRASGKPTLSVPLFEAAKVRR